MKIFDIKELGLTKSAAALVQKMAIDAELGCYVFSGQLGTGKTVTMLSFASEISKIGKNVHLLIPESEEVTSYELDNLPENWSYSLYPDTQEDLNTALIKTAGKENILVLFALDEKAITAAFEFALKGELVLVQLDSSFVGLDVSYTLRSGYMISNENIVDGLAGVVSQVLFTKLCKDCRKKDKADLTTSQLIYPNATQPVELWIEQGCDSCEQTGIKGRTSVNEILWVTDEVRLLMQEYFKTGQYPALPASAHLSMFSNLHERISDGLIGIDTYKQNVLSHPLFRAQHLLEVEQARTKSISE